MHRKKEFKKHSFVIMWRGTEPSPEKGRVPKTVVMTLGTNITQQSVNVQSNTMSSIRRQGEYPQWAPIMDLLTTILSLSYGK